MNFTRPIDKILIFDHTTAVEYGHIDELKRNPSSIFNFWEQRKINLVKEMEDRWSHV
jgi:uncharacterized Zn finger protein